jgi:dephospho-CoA kinase
VNSETFKRAVGLTGGIATGKSQALKLFEEAGWLVLSVDSIVGELLKSDTDVQSQLVSRWGKRILNDCGSIDKGVIGQIVFDASSERMWLESILHPIIRSKWISFVLSCPSDRCMVELPLLFENNLQSHFNCTISMFAPPSLMLARLRKRGLSDLESQQRITAQMTVYQKAELADYVINSSGEVDFLEKQILVLADKFLKD